MPRCRGSEFSVFLGFLEVIDLEIVADRCKEVVVIAGGGLFAEFIPKVAASCSYECLVATPQNCKSVAVFPDQFYCDVCLCHGVSFRLWGRCRPRVCVQSSKPMPWKL